MNPNKVKYFVIIPAAGIGTRTKSEIPKQYLPIKNQPILERVVNLFSSHPQIEKVLVMLHEKDQWWPSVQLSHPEKVFTAIGGKERVHSVLLGLEFLKKFADKNDFILVHDAARPCLTSQNISHLIDELKDHTVGGILGIPVVDTLKKVSDSNTIEKTISREHLWCAQTPQCFRYGILKSAIEKALLENKIITDEAGAIENADLKAKMILGDARNIKITFFEDVMLAEKFLKQEY